MHACMQPRSNSKHDYTYYSNSSPPKHKHTVKKTMHQCLSLSFSLKLSNSFFPKTPQHLSLFHKANITNPCMHACLAWGLAKLVIYLYLYIYTIYHRSFSHSKHKHDWVLKRSSTSQRSHLYLLSFGYVSKSLLSYEKTYCFGPDYHAQTCPFPCNISPLSYHFLLFSFYLMVLWIPTIYLLIHLLFPCFLSI